MEHILYNENSSGLLFPLFCVHLCPSMSLFAFANSYTRWFMIVHKLLPQGLQLKSSSLFFAVSQHLTNWSYESSMINPGRLDHRRQEQCLLSVYRAQAVIKSYYATKSSEQVQFCPFENPYHTDCNILMCRTIQIFHFFLSKIS